MASKTPLAAALFALAGLSGAAGVGVAAQAAHGGIPNGETASLFLLVAAPALAALAAADGWRGAKTSGLLLALGTGLFAAALTLGGLFPMAAPTGGLLMIAGWLGVALAGLRALFRRS